MRTLKYNLSNSRNCFGQLRIVALLFTFLSFWGCTDLSESTYTFINQGDYSTLISTPCLSGVNCVNVCYS